MWCILEWTPPSGPGPASTRCISWFGRCPASTSWPRSAWLGGSALGTRSRAFPLVVVSCTLCSALCLNWARQRASTQNQRSHIESSSHRMQDYGIGASPDSFCTKRPRSLFCATSAGQTSVLRASRRTTCIVSSSRCVSTPSRSFCTAVWCPCASTAVPRTPL